MTYNLGLKTLGRFLGGSSNDSNEAAKLLFPRHGGLLAKREAALAQSITHLGTSVDQTDYSPTGLNLGTAGFWFAQFNAPAPITNALVDDNDVIQFPSWVLPDFNKANTGTPGYSFCLGGTSDCYSEGGNTTWNMLKLPNSTTGLSGAVVDPSTANNSSNTIRSLLLGPGTPSDFLLHVVVDNTNGQHNPDARLRARGQGFGPVPPAFDISGPNDPPPSTYNGIADVYTFRYLGFSSGDIIKLQLNSGNAANRAGIAGLMFDVVPEPTSFVLMLLGSFACAFQAPSKELVGSYIRLRCFARAAAAAAFL